MPEDVKIQLGHKSDEEVAKINGAAALGKTVIDGTSAIIIELLRASAASPIIAAATIVIVSDILAQRNVITEQASANLNLFVTGITSIDVITGVLKPSISTLAYGSDAATASSALLGLLPK